MIEKFAKLIPKSLEKMSGAVFYSGKNAFKGKKDLYIIGLNPGGDFELQENETISWHANEIIVNRKSNFSEYRDGIWKKGKKAGESPMQKRVLHLFLKLGLSPSDVPASNVCFVRSRGESEIKEKLNFYSELCWPVHESIIKELDIKIILCFGQRSGKFVRNKIGAHEELLNFRFEEKNGRPWKTLTFKNPKGQIVITATHPSRADWTNPVTDISPLVKKIYNKYKRK